MFFVYILQSRIDASFYIGFTHDLEKRLSQHNAGLSNYTKRKKPWDIVYSESFDSKSDALKREKFLKKQKNAAFYISLIKHDS